MLAVDFIIARSLEGQQGLPKRWRKGGAYCPKQLGLAIRTQFGKYRINPVKAGTRHHADVKGGGRMHAVGGLYSEECDNMMIVTEILI
jgi:hypothetical protein